MSYIDGLTRDLGLTKAKAEILSPHLKEWNLLDKTSKVSNLKKRHVIYASVYTTVATNSEHFFRRLVIHYQSGVSLLTAQNGA